MLKGKELGQAIKVAIEKKGVTQAEVARLFGVQRASVQGWINNGTIGKDRFMSLIQYFSDVVGPEHWGLTSDKFSSSQAGVLTPDEEALLLLYRGLTKDQRVSLARIAETQKYTNDNIIEELTGRKRA